MERASSGAGIGMMNAKSTLYAASILCVALIGGILIYVYSGSDKSLDRDFSKVQIGTTQFSVEVVATPALRARGLSGRETLPKEDGMLFIFDEAALYSFWMKEMYFPIDIIWLDSSLRVVDITRNALPESYPNTFSPTAPAQYVLEIPAGTAEEKGIEIGDTAAFLY